MTRLYIIRHGQVAWNFENAYIGWTDNPLNETGTEQALKLSSRLKGVEFEAVYSSDLSRSRRTAELIAREHSLDVRVVPELRELNYGKWEGLSPEKIRENFPDIFDKWAEGDESIAIPGGESLADLSSRLVPAVERIIESHPGANVAIVAHKTVNRLLICHWMGISIARYKEIGQDNVALNIIRFIGNRASIETVNDVCHVRR